MRDEIELLEMNCPDEKKSSKKGELIYDIVFSVAEFAEDHHVVYAMCLASSTWCEQVVQTNNYEKLKMVFAFFRSLPRDSVLYERAKGSCLRFDCPPNFYSFSTLNAVIHSEKVLAFFQDQKFSPNKLLTILNSKENAQNASDLVRLFDEAHVENESSEFQRLNKKFTETLGKRRLREYIVYGFLFLCMIVWLIGFLHNRFANFELIVKTEMDYLDSCVNSCVELISSNESMWPFLSCGLDYSRGELQWPVHQLVQDVCIPFVRLCAQNNQVFRGNGTYLSLIFQCAQVVSGGFSISDDHCAFLSYSTSVFFIIVGGLHLLDLRNDKALLSVDGEWKEINSGTIRKITDFFHARTMQRPDADCCAITLKRQ